MNFEKIEYNFELMTTSQKTVIKRMNQFSSVYLEHCASCFSKSKQLCQQFLLLAKSKVIMDWSIDPLFDEFDLKYNFHECSISVGIFQLIKKAANSLDEALIMTFQYISRFNKFLPYQIPTCINCQSSQKMTLQHYVEVLKEKIQSKGKQGQTSLIERKSQKLINSDVGSENNNVIIPQIEKNQVLKNHDLIPQIKGTELDKQNLIKSDVASEFDNKQLQLTVSEQGKVFNAPLDNKNNNNKSLIIISSFSNTKMQQDYNLQQDNLQQQQHKQQENEDSSQMNDFQLLRKTQHNKFEVIPILSLSECIIERNYEGDILVNVQEAIKTKINNHLYLMESMKENGLSEQSRNLNDQYRIRLTECIAYPNLVINEYNRIYPKEQNFLSDVLTYDKQLASFVNLQMEVFEAMKVQIPNLYLSPLDVQLLLPTFIDFRQTEGDIIVKLVRFLIYFRAKLIYEEEVLKSINQNNWNRVQKLLQYIPTQEELSTFLLKRQELTNANLTLFTLTNITNWSGPIIKSLISQIVTLKMSNAEGTKGITTEFYLNCVKRKSTIVSLLSAIVQFIANADIQYDNETLLFDKQKLSGFIKYVQDVSFQQRKQKDVHEIQPLTPTLEQFSMIIYEKSKNVQSYNITSPNIQQLMEIRNCLYKLDSLEGYVSNENKIDQTQRWSRKVIQTTVDTLQKFQKQVVQPIEQSSEILGVISDRIAKLQENLTVNNSTIISLTEQNTLLKKELEYKPAIPRTNQELLELSQVLQSWMDQQTTNIRQTQLPLSKVYLNSLQNQVELIQERTLTSFLTELGKQSDPNTEQQIIQSKIGEAVDKQFQEATAKIKEILSSSMASALVTIKNTDISEQLSAVSRQTIAKVSQALKPYSEFVEEINAISGQLQPKQIKKSLSDLSSRAIELSNVLSEAVVSEIEKIDQQIIEKDLSAQVGKSIETYRSNRAIEERRISELTTIVQNLSNQTQDWDDISKKLVLLDASVRNITTLSTTLALPQELNENLLTNLNNTIGTFRQDQIIKTNLNQLVIPQQTLLRNNNLSADISHLIEQYNNDQRFKNKMNQLLPINPSIEITDQNLNTRLTQVISQFNNDQLLKQTLNNLPQPVEFNDQGFLQSLKKFRNSFNQDQQLKTLLSQINFNESVILQRDFSTKLTQIVQEQNSDQQLKLNLSLLKSVNFENIEFKDMIASVQTSINSLNKVPPDLNIEFQNSIHNLNVLYEDVYSFVNSSDDNFKPPDLNSKFMELSNLMDSQMKKLKGPYFPIGLRSFVN